MPAQTFREWTVIGWWEDTRDSWIEYGSGDTLDEAVKDALSVLETKATHIDTNQLTIIAVLPGRHEDQLILPVSADVAADDDTDLDHVCDDNCRSVGCSKR